MSIPSDHKEDMVGGAASTTFAAAISQILPARTLVFSVDSIITAVGMTPHLPIMVVAVLVAVAVMLLAANPLANFIEKNPTIVMLALAFLLMIGTTLIAEGMGLHVPKGYIYAAMAFSALVGGAEHVLPQRAAESQGFGQTLKKQPAGSSSRRFRFCGLLKADRTGGEFNRPFRWPPEETGKTSMSSISVASG